MHIVQRNGLAHCAELMAVACQIGDDDGAFRLAEAFHNLQARGQLKLAEHLGIQRFAGSRGVLDRGQIVLGNVLLDQHPVHSRRRAEGGDIVLCKQGQDLLRIKAVKVVDENACLAQPLAVELAPGGLCPPGVGNGQMQAVGVDPMPVFCGDKVTQGILVVMGRQLGIAGGAGGEEHQHWIVAAGGILGTGKVTGEQRVLLVKAAPAFPAAVYDDLMLQHRALGCGGIHLVCHIAVGGAEDGLHVAGLEAVCKVLFQQLVGGRDRHSAQLMQTQHRKPILIVAL